MSNPVSSVRAKYDNLRSLGFASISGTYAGVGAQFSHPIRLIKVQNDTDANLFISYNGVDNKDIVMAKGGFVYDFGSNRSEQAGFLEYPIGERFYVKSETSNPTVGSVYVTIAYAAQQ